MPELLLAGHEQDKASLRLWTTGNRHRILNERPLFERPPEAMRAAYRFHKGRWPQIECRSLSSMYNCAGMVFAFRRTIVGCEHIKTCLEDDGYRRVQLLSEVAIGDLVIYRRQSNAVHVGIVTKIDRVGAQPIIFVLSQWGLDGEYLHRAEQIPDLYQGDIEYWTERTLHE